MKKSLLVLAALAAVLVADVGTAQAWPDWRRRARVTYVPAQSVAVAPGAARSGYRTYSYQPAAEYRVVPSMQAPSRRSQGFGNATRKALGQF